MFNLKRKPKEIKKDIFKAFKDVDFFIRIHRHCPDDFCGGDALGRCNYREDGLPINFMNDYVEKLKQDKNWVKKEREVEKAVKKHWKEIKKPCQFKNIFTGEPASKDCLICKKRGNEKY